MAELSDLYVNGETRFLNPAFGFLDGSASYASTAFDFVNTAIRVQGAHTADKSTWSTAANKFNTPTTWKIYGDVLWTASFDGSQNVTSGSSAISISGISIQNIVYSATRGSAASAWIKTNSAGIDSSANNGFTAKQWVDSNINNISQSATNGVTASAWISNTDNTSTIKRLQSGTFANKVINSAWDNGSAKSALTAISAYSASTAKTADNVTYSTHWGGSAASDINGMGNVCNEAFNWCSANSSQAVEGQLAYNYYKGTFSDSTEYSSIVPRKVSIGYNQTDENRFITNYKYSEFCDWWGSQYPEIGPQLENGVSNHVFTNQDAGSQAFVYTIDLTNSAQFLKFKNKTFAFYCPFKSDRPHLVAFKMNFSAGSTYVYPWQFNRIEITSGTQVNITINDSTNSTSYSNNTLDIKYKYKNCKLMFGALYDDFARTFRFLSITNF